jgi:hypothetical protein
MARVWFRLARLDDAPALTLVHDLSRASAVPALPHFMVDREALERWIAQRYIAPALRHRAGIPDPAGLKGMAFADCPGAPHVEIAMVGDASRASSSGWRAGTGSSSSVVTG